MEIRFIYFYKYEVGRSRIWLYTISRARSRDYKFCDQSITIAFFFSVSSNKQVIIKKQVKKNLLTQ